MIISVPNLLQAVWGSGINWGFIVAQKRKDGGGSGRSSYSSFARENHQDLGYYRRSTFFSNEGNSRCSQSPIDGDIYKFLVDLVNQFKLSHRNWTLVPSIGLSWCRQHICLQSTNKEDQEILSLQYGWRVNTVNTVNNKMPQNIHNHKARELFSKYLHIRPLAD